MDDGYATPNHPVQKEACIWNTGGSNQCRNLLDFNEITMDEKGRVLYGYADGCVDECEDGGPNSYSSKATIARQPGEKKLLSQFAPTEPVVPQAACLSGKRDDLVSYLKWVAPPTTLSKIRRRSFTPSARGDSATSSWGRMTGINILIAAFITGNRNANLNVLVLA